MVDAATIAARGFSLKSFFSFHLINGSYGCQR